MVKGIPVFIERAFATGIPMASIVRIVSTFFNVGNLKNIFGDLFNHMGVYGRYTIRYRMDKVVVFSSLDHRRINE